MAARYSVSLHLSEAEYQAFARAAADAGLSVYAAAQQAIREWTATGKWTTQISTVSAAKKGAKP